MSEYRIGIISDTHGLLRPEVAGILRECDAILHAGDVNRRKILDQLEQIAPLWTVRGNNDKEWAEDLPETLSVTLGGLTFFMIHNRKMIGQDVKGADVVICGHTHRYEAAYGDRTSPARGGFRRGAAAGTQLWLNPGSCGPRRLGQPVTMAVMKIQDDGSCLVERADIDDRDRHILRRVSASRCSEKDGGIWSAAPDGAQDGDGGAAKEAAAVIPADIREVVLAVTRDMDRGRPVAQIAERAGISYELAEQICRIYVTHPGVDMDGILRRLGI